MMMQNSELCCSDYMTEEEHERLENARKELEKVTARAREETDDAVAIVQGNRSVGRRRVQRHRGEACDVYRD